VFACIYDRMEFRGGVIKKTNGWVVVGAAHSLSPGISWGECKKKWILFSFEGGWCGCRANPPTLI